MPFTQYRLPTTTPPTPSVTPTPLAGVGTGDVTANSVAGDSPFGFAPDLSKLSPNQIGGITKALSGLTYSTPAGGYLFNNEAQNPNSYYAKFGAGGGGDPQANLVASKVYGLVGAQPTAPGMTSALASLYKQTGLQPVLGPSFNERLGTTFGGPYPFGYPTPHYNPYGQYQPPPF